MAARTARSASSSCAVGTPKTATTASPANFSTVPPYAAMCPAARSKNPVTRRRTISGSLPETSAVESTRSTNSAVASLRSTSLESRLARWSPRWAVFRTREPVSRPDYDARRARPEGLQGVRRPRRPSDRDRRGWRVPHRPRVRRGVRAALGRCRPRHAADGAGDGGGRDRRGGGRRRRRARPRDGRHGDGLLRRRRPGPRRRHLRHGVAQPGRVHGDEDRPARSAPGRRRLRARSCGAGGPRRASARSRRVARCARRTSGRASSRRCSPSSTRPLSGRSGSSSTRRTAWRARCSRLSSNGSRSSTSSRCYFEPDGSFPNHEPNPLLPENRAFIVERTRAEGAQLGVAYDGDADRCFFVDDTGEFVPGDFVTALLAQAMLAKEPGAKVIYDVRASWAVPRAIEEAGGVPLINRVGHAFIKDRMRKEDALFGGEVSAHYYFRDFTQADTGVVPFLVMVELLSRAERPLSELLAPYRERYFLTGELNTPVADVALKLQELKERYTRERRPHLPPRRNLRRLRRLALQRAPLQHRAPPSPEPRGALGASDGGEARRGARADPELTRDHAPRARPRDRPPAAVQVLRADAGLVLRHRRAGCRLLRPLPPLLRPRAHGVPPAPRQPRDRRRRVRDARRHRRVPRARAIRRSARDLRPRQPARANEPCLRAVRAAPPGRDADGHRDPDARARRPRHAPSRRRSPSRPVRRSGPSRAADLDE